MDVITNTKALANFCDALAGERFVTVDTEFMREKTFWPRLCLVQVAGKDQAACIDPQATGIDLAPLFALLDNDKVLKVFHAARQDLEIFFNLTGRVPHPIFDTQVAAMVCGFGDSVGYEAIVANLTKGRIDKSSRFTDWSHRPLTPKQIKYALSDVTHLRGVYEKLKAKLDKNGRAKWLDEEMATLMAPETYQFPPEEGWKRIKGRGAKPRTLAILREVAAWREREAQRLDVPRGRILRDEALLEIAHHTPSTVTDLERVRGLGRGMAQGQAGKQILEAVAAGQAVPDDQLPQPPDRPDLPNNIGPTVDLLKVLLKMCCQDEGVAGKLVANSSDLEQIAAFGEDADVPAMHGWRLDLFGRTALDLCQGRLALRVQGHKVVAEKPPRP